MAKPATVRTRVSAELKGKLAALSKRTKRSEADLAEEAIAAYLDLTDSQVAVIKRRLEKARAGAPTVPHDKVAKWLDSWGSDKELPRPKPSRTA